MEEEEHAICCRESGRQSRQIFLKTVAKQSWNNNAAIGIGNLTTVVPALGDPRRERPPAVYGHVINVPTHLNVLNRPSDERPPAMYGHFCLVPRVSVHDR